MPLKHTIAVLICLFSTSVKAADVTVTFTGIASTQGAVRAALHDGAEGFPRERKMVMGKFTAASSPNGVTLVFEGVAPGRYAITAFHDEDGDEALSTNLLGLPNEPFGFSNDARGSFGPPSFDDAAFEVADEDLSLKISLGK